MLLSKNERRKGNGRRREREGRLFYSKVSLTTPCTTACSPNRMTFPGAETRISPLSSCDSGLASCPTGVLSNLLARTTAQSSLLAAVVVVVVDPSTDERGRMAPDERRDRSRSSTRSCTSSIPMHSLIRCSGRPRSARRWAGIEAWLVEDRKRKERSKGQALDGSERR